MATLPAAPPPRNATAVAASFGRTWDAAIDAFAERGISIETLDRASGLIVPAGRAFPPGRDDKETLTYADCGKDSFGNGVQPKSVKYNVVVRGDSARSTVLVRAFYDTDEVLGVCVSRGRFESEAEANIKAKAEAS